MRNTLAAAMILALVLPSCGLVRLPFRVAGGVVKATGEAVSVPIEANRKRKQKNEREARAAEREAARGIEGGETPLLPDTGESLPDFSGSLIDFPEEPLPSLPAR